VSNPDTILVDQTFVRVPAASVLVTPTSGVQVSLAGALAGADVVSANGMPATAMQVPLTAGLASTGVPNAASATASNFGISMTAGTSLALTTNAANSTTVTNIVLFEEVLPQTYKAGSNITVTVNGNYTLGAGTVGTHTLAMAAYLAANAGTQGSTLIATAAQTVAAAAGDMTFVITGTTLTPGARVILKGTLVIQDTGGSNITAQINSIRLS
jgi:hypothetical protein